MQNIDDLELAALGARPHRKPRPWGWFLAGLLAIGGASFLLSFYVPLKSSYDKLLGEHEALAKKARELDDNFVRTKSALEATEVKRATLQKGVDEKDSAARASSDRLGAVSAAIQKQIGKQIESGLLKLETKPSEIVLRVDTAKVLAPTGKVLPFGTKAFCAVAAAAGKDDGLSVSVALPVSGDKGDVWGNAGKAAGGVAEALQHCKMPSERLNVAMAQPANEADQKTLQLVVKAR